MQGLGQAATDHFADAVLKRGHDGAQAPQLQDHAGQLIAGDAADGLQVLGLMTDIVGADGGAGPIHHVVVKGEDGICSCQGTRAHSEKRDGRCSHQSS